MSHQYGVKLGPYNAVSSWEWMVYVLHDTLATLALNMLNQKCFICFLICIASSFTCYAFKPFLDYSTYHVMEHQWQLHAVMYVFAMKDKNQILGL